MDSARVEICPSQVRQLEECFPWAELRRDLPAARVYNRTNVNFFAHLHRIEVTSDSAEAALADLAWRLNRHRLRLVWRARTASRGPLSGLEEDAARLVCDFVCPEPAR